MENSRTYMLLGGLFIMFSGVIYSLERLNTYVYWNGLVATGTYPSTPQFNFFTQNPSLLIFLILGIALLALGFNSRKK